jgi:hypothetical protein
MLGRILMLGLFAGIAGAPAHAQIINLSCDDGGMLLIIDPAHGTVTDTNPFQATKVSAPLIVTAEAFQWREGKGDGAVLYRMDRASRQVSARVHGAEIPFSNPQCGRSAILSPKS